MGMFMVVYGRGTVVEEFRKIVQERTFVYPANFGYSDITKETIVVVDKQATPNVMNVYSCGTGVVNVEPQSGDALLNSIV